jgi:hypothetical protein
MSASQLLAIHRHEEIELRRPFRMVAVAVQVFATFSGFKQRSRDA